MFTRQRWTPRCAFSIVEAISSRREILSYGSNSTGITIRCSNIAESWRKRRYRAAFVSKLSDSETEAEETRVWLEFSWRCGYISKAEADTLDDQYDHILAQLVLMIDRPEQWLITPKLG